jgi:hypothetical protein
MSAPASAGDQGERDAAISLSITQPAEGDVRPEGVGRAEALRWLFFLSQHIMPPAGEVALRFRTKLFGRPLDAEAEATIKRGEGAPRGHR